MTEQEDKRFIVLFIPQTSGNMTIPQLKANMQSLFAISDEELAVLFSGEPIVIKRDVDEDTALTYKRSIEEGGGSCWIQPIN